MDGIVFDINEMTVHDGDGVRVSVFLKGCPLRCAWCHNPEGVRPAPQLIYKKSRCTDCGLCKIPCSHEACRPFGRCLRVCPNDCLQVCGVSYGAEELAHKLSGYKTVLNAMGGGITFTGGEPLYQWRFLSELIDALDGFHLAMETSGYADSRIFQQIIEKLDLIIMDIKLIDPALHKKYTGVDNAGILNNFKLLKQSGKRFIIRTPLIAGITDSEENLRGIAGLVKGCQWERLAENPLAEAKQNTLL